MPRFQEDFLDLPIDAIVSRDIQSIKQVQQIFHSELFIMKWLPNVFLRKLRESEGKRGKARAGTSNLIEEDIKVKRSYRRRYFFVITSTALPTNPIQEEEIE